mgnify:CR=1 FL=1
MKKKEEDVYDKIAKLMMESKELVTSKDVSNALNIIQGKILQSMLEGELSYHLEYEKNSKEEKNTENRRNGYSSKNKRIRTNNGEITISMPRDRDGSFEPTIIGKRQRVLNDIDDSIICMYAKGMSLSDITDIVKETYKIEVSTSFISTIVKQVTTDLEKWNNRSLKSFYPFLYVDCLYTYVKEELISVKRPVYVIIGIDITGHKEVIGTWLGDSNGEGAYFWRQIFEELKSRGVKDILYVSMDGLKGLEEAINEVYPRTQTQRCVVHLTRNLYGICPKKGAKEIIGDFKKIYTSSSLEQGLLELENLKNKHQDKKKIVLKVEEYMEYIKPLFELPQEIRKIIYTTNPIESVNSALRKVTRGKGSFPNKEALMKVLFLRIQDLEKKWSKGTKGWNTVLSQLIELHEERITQYLEI